MLSNLKSCSNSLLARQPRPLLNRYFAHCMCELLNSRPVIFSLLSLSGCVNPILQYKMQLRHDTNIILNLSHSLLPPIAGGRRTKASHARHAGPAASRMAECFRRRRAAGWDLCRRSGGCLTKTSPPAHHNGGGG